MNKPSSKSHRTAGISIFLRCCSGLAAGLFLIVVVPLAMAQSTGINFNFALTRGAHTSAGVYGSSGTLCRTLWSDAFITGTNPFSGYWDGLDDWGRPAPSGDTYTIKVLAHNLNYVWEGVVGNTSDLTSGTTVHADLNFTTTLSFLTNGSTGCYSTGYSEASPTFFSFSTSDPQQLTRRFSVNSAHNGNFYGWYFSDADSSSVYFACPNTIIPPLMGGTSRATSYYGAVCKFDPVAGTSVHFGATSGTIYEQQDPCENGIYVVGGSNALTGTCSSVTGLAVQKNGGSLLAVSVAADNMVYLYNKSTGALSGSFGVTWPKALAMDNSDNLWVISGSAAPYSINQYLTLSGTPVLGASVTASGTAAPVDPIAMAVSPATAQQPNLLLITDGSNSQQVKAFNMSGAYQWTLGVPGGFANGSYPNGPAVTGTGGNILDKFWFYNPDAYGAGGGGPEQASIAFQPDGTFWVVDCMNNRSLHYQLNGTPLTPPALSGTYPQLAWIDKNYQIAADSNNPNRLFESINGKFLEFKIDYTKPLSGTSGWTLVNDWGHGLITPSLSGTTQKSSLWGVSTLTVGGTQRTYALFQNYNYLYLNPRSLVELTGTGMRITGTTATYSGTTGSSYISSDGNGNGFFRFENPPLGASTTGTFTQQTVSFDASGNPLLGS
ncbi:MAG: hypothetical protein WCD79_17235, partial [Chthoniobacteraceae bacterium]